MCAVDEELEDDEDDEDEDEEEDEADEEEAKETRYSRTVVGKCRACLESFFKDSKSHP